MKKVLSFSLIGILIFQPFSILAEENFAFEKDKVAIGPGAGEQGTFNKKENLLGQGIDILDTKNQTNSITSGQDIGASIQENFSGTTELGEQRRDAENFQALQLLITEVYFQGKDEWIEITNLANKSFDGELQIHYGTKNPKKVTLSLPAKSSGVVGRSSTFLSPPDHYTKGTFQLADSRAFTIAISYEDIPLDTFSVSTREIRAHPKKTSFEKVEEDGTFSIIPTSKTRTRNMKEGYFGNPGFFFSLNEELPGDDPTPPNNNETSGEIQSGTLSSSFPQLVITEAFFHKSNSWIELSNIGTGDYSGDIQIKGANKEGTIFNYSLVIPANTSLVVAENTTYFTGEFLKYITTDKYTLDWNSGLNLTLTYGSEQEDHLVVHPERTNYLQGKDTSFEKVLLNGERLTTRTTLERRKNSKVPFVTNPGLYFTEAENAKDISQPKTPEEPGSHPEVSITCSAFTDRYRLEIQEIFQGNSVYQPFVELKWTDTPAEYQAIRLTGTILEKETIINKSELREKNKTFVIGKNEFWHDKGIDSDFHSDFTLLNQTGYLIIEGFNGQTRQVLDTVLLTTITSGKSSYFGGDKSECVPIFDKVGEFSPGFNQKFLDFFQIDSEPKIEYIKIGGGGSCNCPSKEDLCPAKDNKKEKTEPTAVEDEKNHISSDHYQVKIENIDYDPPGEDKDKESITLILTEGDSLDLSRITLNINGKNKKMKGVLQQGVSQTFFGNFGFPNSSKTSDTILVQLKDKDHVLDSYYYKIQSKKNIKKEQIKPEGIKVFSVIDGDTIRYKDEHGKLQSIRMLGIDAPESNTARYKKTECYGKEAKDYLAQRLKGKFIQLSFDDEQATTDRYGRLLAYVSLDNQLINEELIAKGFAKEYTYKQAYQKQEQFKTAQQQAQADQLGMRNPTTCPNLLEQEEKIKQTKEQLIIKIKAIDYDPKGSDKDNESITLALFDKPGSGEIIDFSNQFGLFIIENNSSGVDLSFEAIEGNGKFVDLSFLGQQAIKNPLILKGNFGLPNTKSSCIALVQQEHLFDIACYEVEKNKKEKKPLSNEEVLTGIQLKIHSLTPNPKGKDTGKEKITLSFHSEYGEKNLFLGSGFYLLINGKSKKALSGQLEKGKLNTFEGTFNFPNTPSCVEIKKGNQAFDTFCYGKTQDGQTYTSTNKILTNFATEELATIKAVKLIKVENKHCISYRDQTFTCRNIPNSRTQQEKQWKTKAQIRESAFLGLENLLKTEYRPWYKESKISEYFHLAKTMKSDLKKNHFSTSIGIHTFAWKDFPTIFEKKDNPHFSDTLGFLIQNVISPELISLYHKKKQEWIKKLPDEI